MTEVAYTFSSGAEWLSAYRTCQVHPVELRTGRRISMANFNMRFDDTNPTKEEGGIRRVYQDRTSSG